MNNSFWESNLGLIIRWLLLLPGSIAAYLLALSICYLLNWLRGDLDNEWANLIVISAPAFAWSFSLMAAEAIAPKAENIVLYIFGGVRLFLTLIWFTDPSTFSLSIGWLIAQEILINLVTVVMIIRVRNKYD